MEDFLQDVPEFRDGRFPLPAHRLGVRARPICGGFDDGGRRLRITGTAKCLLLHRVAEPPVEPDHAQELPERHLPQQIDELRLGTELNAARPEPDQLDEDRLLDVLRVELAVRRRPEMGAGEPADVVLELGEQGVDALASCALAASINRLSSSNLSGWAAGIVLSCPSASESGMEPVQSKTTDPTRSNEKSSRSAHRPASFSSVAVAVQPDPSRRRASPDQPVCSARDAMTFPRCSVLVLSGAKRAGVSLLDLGELPTPSSESGRRGREASSARNPVKTGGMTSMRRIRGRMLVRTLVLGLLALSPALLYLPSARAKLAPAGPKAGPGACTRCSCDHYWFGCGNACCNSSCRHQWGDHKF